MSRPIEQALTTLIPRNSGALPSELIELASSLLAQSRNKCSNLKAEEEVARTYACANLACERLKTTLNLPPIEPRPPIPPRVYSKLYSYFDRSLVTSSSRKASQSRAPKSTPTKPLPQRQTPQKEKSLATFQNHRTPKKGLRYAAKKDKDERIPIWLGPVTRSLCRELETPRAVPHILAGVESILTLPRAEKDGETEMNGKLPALISAIWFFVVVKMRGKENQGIENLSRKKLAREALARTREDEVIIAKIGDGEEEWLGWEPVEERDVNAWRKEIVAKGWKEMDWFENIEEGCGVQIRGENNDEIDGTSEDEDEGPVLKQNRQELGRGKGLGTMMLDKHDYLTEAKRREYAVWKEAMLRKIDELVAEGAINENEMDITEG